MSEAPSDHLLECPVNVRFSEASAKKIPFRRNIERQRVRSGLTQQEAAKLVQVTERTWRRWESGDVVPSIRTQARVFRALEPKRPSPRRRADLERSHHLYWEKHKGWFLRVTIQLRAKEIGKRIKVRLYTHDEKTAKERREVVLAAYRKLGLKVTARVLRDRTKKDCGASAND